MRHLQWFPMGRVTRRVPTTRLDLSDPGAPVVVTRPDTVAVEEPLEMRVGPLAEPVAVTMRTPGDDFELVLGHLLTEGLVHAADDVATMMHCTDTGADGSPTFNVVEVTLRAGTKLRARPAHRTETMTSSCGVCGKDTIDAIRTTSRFDVADDPLRLDATEVLALPERLRAAQPGFERTGGMHAAALLAPDGSLVVTREDVGRHNAVDKVIGAAARSGALPLRSHTLVVSARASFELVHKAFAAGIPALVAVSAPTSLAVDLAREAGMTLVAFTRPPRLSVYAGAGRVRARPRP